MATQLSIYNGALIHLEERAIASLSDDVAPRYELDSVWGSGFVERVLSRSAWSFALKSVEITDDPNAVPIFGYQYSFELPSDYVLMDAISSEEYIKNTLEDYKIKGKRIYSDVTPIYIDYVSSATSVGDWAESFAEYVELYLAYRASGRVGKSSKMRERLLKESLAALKQARGDDGRGKSAIDMPVGRWRRSRLNGRNNNYYERG